MPQGKGKAIEFLKNPYHPFIMKKQFPHSMSKICLTASAIALASLLPTHAATAKISSNLVGHKAFYEMQMGDRLQNSHIVNINGRSAFAIERDCSG